MPTQTPKDYDFRNVVVTYGGVRIEGFADGEAVSYDPNGDSVTSQMGADGELVVVRGPDKPATFTLRLMQTSASNGYLSSQQLLQSKTGSAAMLPLVITDTQTGSTHACDKAWFIGPPAASYGTEAGVREWRFGGIPVIKLAGVL